MDEMTMLRQTGALLDPPAHEPPADLRERVLDRLAAEAQEAATSSHGPALRAVGSGRGASRRVSGGRAPRRIALVAGVAAVAAGALAIAPTLGDRPTASAAAVELLESAAEQAAQQPAWDPRPDQLVYTRALEVAYSMAELDGEGVESLVTQTREAWRSVDGLHPGLIKGVVKPGTDPLNPEGGPYEIPLEPCDGTWEGCGDIPAFPVGMPTDGDPDAMLAFLRKATEPYDMGPGRKEHKPDQEVFDEAAALLRQGGLAPQMESAVLGAVARIPGVTTSGNVSDAAGRDGVGVGLTTAYGVRVDLVIDPESEEFLGVRELSPEGELTGAWALFEAGVVDAVGEMP